MDEFLSHPALLPVKGNRMAWNFACTCLYNCPRCSQFIAEFRQYPVNDSCCTELEPTKIRLVSKDNKCAHLLRGVIEQWWLQTRSCDSIMHVRHHDDLLTKKANPSTCLMGQNMCIAIPQSISTLWICKIINISILEP